VKKFLNKRGPGAWLLALLLLSPGLGAQDYWFEESGDSAGNEISAGKLRLKTGGEIAGELLVFPRDLSGGRAGAAEWGNLVSAKLNFDVSSPNAEAALHFNLSPRSILDAGKSSNLLQTPMIIDELYLRAFLGPLTLETGLRKLAWGRADVQGPLDVTNPLDYTDLTNAGDTMGRKIARPMIRASLPLGSVSRLEGVFIPNFQGHRYSLSREDRWYPRVITDMRRDSMIASLIGELARINPALLQYGPMMQNAASGINLTQANLPETQGLEYAQGGLRFTSTLGQADIGVQYYSGYLFRPAFTMGGVENLVTTAQNPAAVPAAIAGLSPRFAYNRYHQIGADYTQVLFGFSFRAELAASITGDIAGDDGEVYNPSLGWSAGFDRDFFGFTLFAEADETIRLFNSKVGGSAALDTEAGMSLTSTAITTRISRNFFQDKLELKISLLWNIEAGDIYLMPSAAYVMGDLRAELSGGVFAGKDGGELSQYRDNGYIKTVLKYSF
jgi:hypothetical protein